MKSQWQNNSTLHSTLFIVTLYFIGRDPDLSPGNYGGVIIGVHSKPRSDISRHQLLTGSSASCKCLASYTSIILNFQDFMGVSQMIFTCFVKPFQPYSDHLHLTFLLVYVQSSSRQIQYDELRYEKEMNHG